MSFVLVDYSAAVYGDEPPTQRGGKFIQVRNLDTEYMVLSLKQLTPYHANIAERFFSEMRVAGGMNDKKTLFTLNDGEWEIVGGGSWEIDAAAQSIRLFGASQAYGQFERRGLAEQIKSVQGFAAYSVNIE